jgi:iron(III) transport system ATP-binding protein
MAEHTGEQHIEVDDLVVCYGDVMAIKGVSFAVRRGEPLTLLGPAGCGKTTTLGAIAGLEQPSAGEIRIGGQVVYSSTPCVNALPEKCGVSIYCVLLES